MLRWTSLYLFLFLTIGGMTVCAQQTADALPGDMGVQAVTYVETHTQVIALNGTMMAPLTMIAERGGAAVGYDEETKAIIVHGLEHTLTLRTGSQAMLVDGKACILPLPVRIYHGVTFAPVRAVAESLNLLVGWNAQQQTVYLTDRTQGELARYPVTIFLNTHGKGGWQLAGDDPAWTALPIDARPLAQVQLGKTATQYAAWVKTQP